MDPRSICVKQIIAGFFTVERPNHGLRRDAVA